MFQIIRPNEENHTKVIGVKTLTKSIVASGLLCYDVATA